MHGSGGVRWARALGLFVFLLAGAAFAGRVVVFDLPGDQKGRLREQLDAAVREAHTDRLVPFATYQREAARQRLEGARAVTPKAVAQVSGALHLSLVVTGAVAQTFYVRFLDPDGKELWSKDLPLRRGRLSPANARRLAKAVSAAVRQVEAAASAPAEPPRAEAPVHPEIAPARSGAAGPAKGSGEARRSDGAGSSPEHPAAPGASPASAPHAHGLSAAPSPTVPGPPLSARAASAALPPAPPPAPEALLPRPPTVRVLLLADATFRSYCARPGVSGCAAYDDQSPDARAAGPTVDFAPHVPYAGFDLGLELFPLASLSGPARGLGLLGELHRGFELTRVHQQSATGPTPDTEAAASELDLRAEAAYRWYFGRRAPSGLLAGYVGGHLGYLSRAFDVDSSVAAILPGAHHRGLIVGAQAGYPFARWLRAEASAELYPHLRTGEDETVGFGSQGSGWGFGLRVGPAGQLWGPLGYAAQLRYTRIVDTFEGQGVSWQTGGVAQVSHLTLHLGLTVQL